jgi:hypothetical protein
MALRRRRPNNGNIEIDGCWRGVVALKLSGEGRGPNCGNMWIGEPRAAAELRAGSGGFGREGRRPNAIRTAIRCSRQC